MAVTPTADAPTLTEATCRLDDLRAITAERVDPADYPHAVAVEQEVLVFAAEDLPPAAEFVRAFSEGPGVVVIRDAFPDPAVVDAVTAQFESIIAEQPSPGDHFAAAGTNDRIWNATEKLAVRAPAVFCDYYANPVIAAVSLAWLGPGYQVTSQPNVVRPGGRSQVGHRDYHLGFLAPDQIARYPRHIHRLSPVLTLQGAIAHVDMPLESGPTLYLPHSHKYEAGYLTTNRPDFQRYFEDHHVQLPLRKGDAAFFNPAVIHGAGTNRSSDVRRFANLLQINSAFGRAMDQVDRRRVCAAIYPSLLAYERHLRTAGVSESAVRRLVGNVVAASAEGYPFPTNLDLDAPVDGLAPPSQADVMLRALADGWEPAAFTSALDEHARRRA
jgi:ectoine hydroxylase-related dioxygenase (phytanoyl-CoA dioxygenase family)